MRLARRPETGLTTRCPELQPLSVGHLGFLSSLRQRLLRPSFAQENRLELPGRDDDMARWPSMMEISS